MLQAAQGHQGMQKWGARRLMCRCVDVSVCVWVCVYKCDDVSDLIDFWEEATEHCEQLFSVP